MGKFPPVDLQKMEQGEQVQGKSGIIPHVRDVSKQSVSSPFDSRREHASRQGDMNWGIIPPVEHVSSQW
jgi:hypothetical protein